MGDNTPPTTTVSPYRSQAQTPQVGKGKSLLAQPAQDLDLMNLIIWNTRGANSASFHRQCEAMVKTHKPAMLVLLETMMVEHKAHTETLRFDAQVQSSASGMKDGIVVMLKEEFLKLNSISITNQGVHVMVKVIPDPKPWLFSVVYASPDLSTRLSLWEELCQLAQSHNEDWLIGGDFNEVLSSNEKLGGNYPSPKRILEFRQCLDNCSMIDLGYKGCKYTKTNKRHRNRQCLILERLDRYVANDSWIKRYPESTMTHLPRTKSDHCPLLPALSNQRSPLIANPLDLNLCGPVIHPSRTFSIGASPPPPNSLSQAINTF
ncbi:uncharacterized protein LOC124888831 [Capsicum annuum]|uniref:uncharacterized protein LOC124888831 n=1 Tax=Capsicum annuum TaxID=4072 RepID=UPI001FB16C46|nr:uncharacterized protein LOC124888831 [Capsicum annuum]